MGYVRDSSRIYENPCVIADLSPYGMFSIHLIWILKFSLTKKILPNGIVSTHIADKNIFMLRYS